MVKNNRTAHLLRSSPGPILDPLTPQSDLNTSTTTSKSDDTAARKKHRLVDYANHQEQGRQRPKQASTGRAHSITMTKPTAPSADTHSYPGRAKQPPNEFSFLALPLEIQSLICDMLYLPPYICPPNTQLPQRGIPNNSCSGKCLHSADTPDTDQFRYYVSPFLLTSRQIYTSFAPRFWQRCRIRFHDPVAFADDFLSRLSPMASTNLRHLVFVMDTTHHNAPPPCHRCEYSLGAQCLSIFGDRLRTLLSLLSTHPTMTTLAAAHLRSLTVEYWPVYQMRDQYAVVQMVLLKATDPVLIWNAFDRAYLGFWAKLCRRLVGLGSDLGWGCPLQGYVVEQKVFLTPVEVDGGRAGKLELVFTRNDDEEQERGVVHDGQSSVGLWNVPMPSEIRPLPPAMLQCGVGGVNNR